MLRKVLLKQDNKRPGLFLLKKQKKRPNLLTFGSIAVCGLVIDL